MVGTQRSVIGTKQRHVIKNNKCGCRLGKVDELAFIKKAKLWREDVSDSRGKDVGIRKGDRKGWAVLKSDNFRGFSNMVTVDVE